MRLTIPFTGLLAVILFSCSKNNSEPIPPPGSTKNPINFSMGIATRATDSNFESGDKVGIYAVNYTDATTPGTLAASGNHMNNVGVTYNGTSWTPDVKSHWMDETTKVDFYCYYPYVSTPSGITAYPFSVNTDQSVEANYKASDFLWGKTAGVSPSSNPVQITTKHAMSNVLIYLEPGDGFTTESLSAATKSVFVCNTKPNATIDLATGAATAAGSVADIKARTESGGYYRALIVPQTVSGGIALVRITIDGEDYILKQNLTFEAHKQHKCTVTVSNTAHGVNVGIAAWEIDDIDHGGTAGPIHALDIPDANFKAYLIENFDIDKDGEISEYEASLVEYMDCYNKNIASLCGIEFFKNLKSLNCGINQLIELDVSNNTVLSHLFCFSNLLTELDVSKNPVLVQISCGENQLTELDISKNTVLTNLACSYNQLTELDISKNTTLQYLSCHSNQLTELDVSRNTALIYLYCADNQLTELDVSNTNLGDSPMEFPLRCVGVFMSTLQTLYLKTGWEINGINVDRNMDYIPAGTTIEYK